MLNVENGRPGSVLSGKPGSRFLCLPDIGNFPCHSRHCLSGISLCPVTAKMDPRLQLAGMTEGSGHA